MDINKITYFFTAAEMGNFTKAADKCHIAQTTMSRYIKQLEDELECDLFVRNNRDCYLTAQGELFYEHTKELYEEWRIIVSKVNRTNKAEIKIGLEGDFSAEPILNVFKRSDVEAKITLVFGERWQLLEDLQKKHLDAIVVSYQRSDDYTIEESVMIDLHIQEEVVVCSKQLFNEHGSISDVIKGTAFITKSANVKYHDHCRKTLMEQHGASFRKVIVVNTYSRQELLLALMRGFAILPKSEVEDRDDRVVHGEINLFENKIALLYYPKDASEVFKKVVDKIRIS